jgi:hypothetical protein
MMFCGNFFFTTYAIVFEICNYLAFIIVLVENIEHYE